MKIVDRKRGTGGFQRLVVMRESEYDSLKNAAKSNGRTEADPTNELVEKYLEPGGILPTNTSAEERLRRYEVAKAHANASEQFDRGAKEARSKYNEEDEEALGDGKMVILNKDSPEKLPVPVVPSNFTRRANALRAKLESSGTVRVDKDSRVWLNEQLLDSKSDYDTLMYSLFVQSRLGDNTPGRQRFLEHLATLGISADLVSAKSAKRVLEKSAVAEPENTDQLGGRKRRLSSHKKVVLAPAHTTSPPGKRSKPLFMYR